MLHIEEENEFYRGCTLGEIGLILASHIALTLPLFFFIDYRFVFMALVFAAIIGVTYTSGKLQETKRNKPKNFYQKKFAAAFGLVSLPAQYNIFMKL